MQRDFHSEARSSPFELALDNGDVVVLHNPAKLPSTSVFDLARETDYATVLRALLADDFEKAWQELQDWSVDEVGALIDAAFEHHGADRDRTAGLASVLDRYGEAIEVDISLQTPYKLREFFDGTETANTLANLVAAFSKQRTSHLAAAQATDIEAYEASLDPETGKPRGSRRDAPELTEVGYLESVMMSLVEQMQALIHYTAANAPKKAGKPKVKKLPRPKTAAHLLEQQRTREAYLWVDSHITFVDQETFEQALREGE